MPVYTVFPYYGGKIRMIDFIKRNAPPANGFIDLFGGSGVVGWNLYGHYKFMLYNDVNTRLFNFFKVLRDDTDELVRLIMLTPYSRKDYGVCAEKSDDPVEDARRVYVRCKQSYASCGLFNESESTWSAPTNRHSNPVSDRTDCKKNLLAVASMLKEIVLENRDWRKVVEKYQGKNILIFADPPYDLASRSGGKAYSYEMTEDDHRDLERILRESKGPAMVCGYHSDVYDDIYKDWECAEMHMIAPVGAGKKEDTENMRRTEALWIKR